MGVPFYVICHFFPCWFQYFIFVFNFVALITMCLYVFFLGFTLSGTLCTSCTWLTISFPMLGNVSAVISSNISRSFLSLLSFWDPYNANVGAFNVVQRSLSSVQFSRSVVSDSLQPHEPQHASPPCPSPTPRVYPNSCPLSRWCYPTHPLSSPSPPALNLSQHQGLFKWVSF